MAMIDLLVPALVPAGRGRLVLKWHIALLLLAACARTSFEADGGLTRASFELKCTEDQLEVQALARNEFGTVMQVGVTGCGKQAVYVRGPSGWVNNTGK